MIRFLFTISTVALWLAFPHSSAAADADSIVEVSKPIKAMLIGTKKYEPTEQEKQFASKVNEVPPPTGWFDLIMPPPAGEKEDPKQVAEQKKHNEEELARAKAYTLASQSGKYVAWFAIARGYSWNEKAHQTELLLEHKYSDELTDVRLQVVSIYGAGDFRANLRGKFENIPYHALVRIYGKLSIGKDGIPVIAADYLRVWNWGLFTFMDYGLDKSNPKWVSFRKIPETGVYTARVTPEYYESLLGKSEK